MGSGTKRVVIGSESNDDRKIELYDLGSGTKIALPVSIYNTDGNHLNLASGLVPENFDYISLTYTSGNLTGVVYRTGGSGGTVVATLALTYDPSDVLQTITKT